MNKTRPVPVRLDDEILSRLSSAAERIGVENRTDVIKYCIKTFLDYYDAHGYESLRPTWDQIIEELDGRIARHQNGKRRK